MNINDWYVLRRSLKVDAIIRGGIRRYTDQLGHLWNSLADYYIRSGLFERVSIFKEVDKLNWHISPLSHFPRWVEVRLLVCHSWGRTNIHGEWYSGEFFPQRILFQTTYFSQPRKFFAAYFLIPFFRLKFPPTQYLYSFY